MPRQFEWGIDLDWSEPDKIQTQARKSACKEVACFMYDYSQVNEHYKNWKVQREIVWIRKETCSAGTEFRQK
jgi:hypothetical protein